MIFSRTKLRISLSKAKNCEEADFDVQKAVAPPKLAKKAEKQKKCPKNFRKKFLGVEKLGLGNRLKRVLTKFEADRSFV